MLKRISEIYKSSKFSRNTAPKVLSLVFAIVFWIFVMDKVNPEMTREIEDVHIELIGIEELSSRGFEIMGERDFVVNVKIKGRRSVISNVDKDSIQVKADLGALTDGNQSVILKKNISIEEVFITEMSKQDIQVIIDEIVRIPIDVKIIKQGSVPEGFFEEEMTYSIQQVFVKGPKLFVQSIASMQGIINVTNATTDIQKEVAINCVDHNGEVVTNVIAEADYITVTIPVLKLGNIVIQPRTTGTTKAGYEKTAIEVIPNTVELRGELENINELKFVETKPINLDGIKDSFEISTELEIPEGIETSESNLEVIVKVTIEEIITKEFTFAYEDIPFINMKPNYRTNIADLDGSVLLRITAIESVLSSISKNDLGLYIDAEYFEEGTSSIELELNKGNDFKTVEIIPSSLELEIYDINNVKEIEDTSVTDEEDPDTETTEEPSAESIDEPSDKPNVEDKETTSN